MDKTIKLNETVRIRTLSDGQKYLLLKVADTFQPLFLNETIISQLECVGYDGCLYECAENMIGNPRLFSLLCKTNILCEKCEKIIGMNNFKFSDESTKLNYLSYQTRTPVLAKFEITYRCNFKCKYCYVDGMQSGFAPLEKIINTIDQLNQAGVCELYLTGGEPLLHPDILKIIDYCQDIKMPLTVQTNGSLINDELIEHVVHNKYIKFAISFHTNNEKVFDSFTQVEGSYIKVINGVELLRYSRVPFFLKLNVTNENEAYLESSISFCEKRGYAYQIFAQILPNIAGGEDTSDYRISDGSLKWLYEKGYIKFSKHICSACIMKVWIAPNGDIYPCELIREVIGNIFADNFKEIWNGKKASDFLKKEELKEPLQCRGCDYAAYCNKCPAYLLYDQWGGGLNSFCGSANVVKTFLTNEG